MLMCVHRLQSWRDRKREEEDDAQFPDEIDTPLDVPARTRFQRYRGLRSFRTSPWGPYENLPRDYARIFQFEDFKRTERAVHRRAEEEGGVPVSVRLPSVRHVLSSTLLYHTARNTCHGLPERRSERGCSDCTGQALHDLQFATARAQEDRPQLHRAAQHRV